MYNLYLSIIVGFIMLSEASPQEVDIRRIGAAIGRILGDMEIADPSKSCDADTTCRASEKCILTKCRNPCRTECGINAVCSVVDHEAICKCPNCHDGDALIECTPYQGLKEGFCLWQKFIRKRNLKSAYISKLRLHSERDQYYLERFTEIRNQ